ncbi:MAG: dTDP-4-dehydrorhamnose 3,5-epimerase, partial [Clostridia bacterium]|nr:dTDP-4-dehydrorhamnose 3,5-epimerase [Deltaproteobacteria bacterium]
MNVTSLTIPDVKLITMKRFGDDRGFFSETFSERALADAGITHSFVQDNHSLSREVNTVRGLHLQLSPTAQGKLVRVPRGRILDVAVDVRRGSPTYGEHVAVEISSEAWNAIYVPPGFAHGFCTLEPDTEVTYKVTAYYSPENERGVLWHDPALNIAWPCDTAKANTSPKDRIYPKLADCETFFHYDG